MKLIEIILEIIGWFQIVLSATLGAGLIAGIIYIKWNSDTGKVIAIVILSMGFLFGVIWATRIWRKHGTTEWLSGIRKIS